MAYSTAISTREYMSGAATLDPWTKRVIKCLLDAGNPWMEIPVITSPLFYREYTQLDTAGLGTVGYRKLNEDPGSFTATFRPRTAQSYILSAAQQMEKKLRAHGLARDGVDPLVRQFEAAALAASYSATNSFFNNNPVTGDQDAGPGLLYILTSTDSGALATEYGANSTCIIDAGALDMTSTGVSAASFRAFTDRTAECLDAMGNSEGNDVHLFVPRELRRRIDSGAQAAGGTGGWATTKDTIGDRVTKFRNATFHAVGPKQDQTTETLGSEASTGGAYSSGARYCSMVGIWTGEDQFQAWQDGPMKVHSGMTDPYQIYDLALMDWGHGYALKNTRCISRLFGLKLAA